MCHKVLTETKIWSSLVTRTSTKSSSYHGGSIWVNFGSKSLKFLFFTIRVSHNASLSLHDFQLLIYFLCKTDKIHFSLLKFGSCHGSQQHLSNCQIHWTCYSCSRGLIKRSKWYSRVVSYNVHQLKKKSFTYM